MNISRSLAVVLAGAVVALTTFNVTFRLGSETLAEWDESLYATTAFEMVESRDWIATTFHGALDYSNAKPPLNVWLIALSIETFGASLVTVRLASVISSFLTVLVLLVWAWRRFSPRVGVLSALVLTTSFAFLQVHSGKTANPDALLTLLGLLIVVVLDGASERPWRRVWLGPLLAGVFLLKGMAVLMPLLLIAFMEIRWRLERRDLMPLLLGVALALLPIGAWAIARWHVDREAFFAQMLFQDLVGSSTITLDGHAGSPLYYLNILQKHHYDWIAAACIAAILFRPPAWAPVWRSLKFWAANDDRTALVGCWAAVTLLVPTLMQTKLPWYLNPFYPMFALGVGWVLDHAFAQAGRARQFNRALLFATVALALIVAESKLVWYSYERTSNVQSLLLDNTEHLQGKRVFARGWSRADAFIVRGIVRAQPGEASSVHDFIRKSLPGDYFVGAANLGNGRLVRVASSGSDALYRRKFRRRALSRSTS